jgi:hypothetical protein
MVHSQETGKAVKVPRKFSLCAALAASIGMAAGTARADEAADTAAARALGGDGVTLADAGDCQQATEKLRRAEELHHAPTTAGRLGECEIGTGHIVAGTERLQRLLREPLAANAPAPFVDALARARRVLERAFPRIATMRVSVKVPAGTKAQVIVDGERMPEALIDNDRPADPGHHTILATAKGFFAKTEEINLTEGEKTNVTVELTLDPTARAAALREIEAARVQAATSSAASSAATGPSSNEPTHGGIAIAPIVAFAAGGIGLATGIASGLVVAHDSGDLTKACGASRVCPSDRQSEINSAKTWATVSTIGFGIAGAGLGTGVLLLLLGTHHESPAAAEATIRPVIGPLYLGLEGAL